MDAFNVKVAPQVVTLKPSENAGDQCFSPSNTDGRLPRVGLEPSRENTGNAPALRTGGSPGGTVNPNSAFNTALIESGFSPAEVTLILSAFSEAGFAVVAMGAGALED